MSGDTLRSGKIQMMASKLKAYAWEAIYAPSDWSDSSDTMPLSVGDAGSLVAPFVNAGMDAIGDSADEFAVEGGAFDAVPAGKRPVAVVEDEPAAVGEAFGS